MNVYIAGPFSKPEERKELEHMIDLVKKYFSYWSTNLHIYIPMEYKVPGAFKKEDGTWSMPDQDWAKYVFDHDRLELNDTDIVIAMYMGHYSSTGTPWELGYCFAKQNCTIVGYIPDIAKDKDMSLMVLNSFDGFLTNEGHIVKSTPEILSQFKQK